MTLEIYWGFEDVSSIYYQQCPDVLVIIGTLIISFNPPTDRPLETIQNFHFQKCPLVLYTHGDTIWTVLVASCTTIHIHSNGLRGSIDSPLRSIQTRFCIRCTTIWKDPDKVLYKLYYHLERSKQAFVLAVLPFWKIQTRFCISWPTIQNHLGNQHCTQLFHHSKPQLRMVSNSASTCIKKVPKVGGLRKEKYFEMKYFTK